MNVRLLSAVVPALLAALLLSVPISAQSVETVNPGPDAAKLVGVPGFPNRDIFGVRFLEINGENIVPRESLWLKPGSYRIKVAIDAAFTRPPKPEVARDPDKDENVIELELEAGKVYHVRGRYDRDAEDPSFSVILHKVDE
ncbi:MAG TPA: hypothetical protein VKA17_07595 [Gammaproteobacteria bacterium]|nr:hypothetical protein [Gammaproteobacteria bacterium]